VFLALRELNIFLTYSSCGIRRRVLWMIRTDISEGATASVISDGQEAQSWNFTRRWRAFHEYQSECRRLSKIV